jgi:hypothetical protein
MLLFRLTYGQRLLSSSRPCLRRSRYGIRLSWPPAYSLSAPQATAQRPYTARTRQCPRMWALCGAVPAPHPRCLGRYGGAAPPPCSRPHPRKEPEGEVGDTTVLLCKQKGSRGRVIENHWGKPGTPPSTPSGPVPGFPPDPLPASPQRRRPPHQ